MFRERKSLENRGFAAGPRVRDGPRAMAMPVSNMLELLAFRFGWPLARYAVARGKPPVV
jgi:hypothetical protein